MAAMVEMARRDPSGRGQTATLMRRELPSNEWLVTQIAFLAEARQAAVNPQTFTVYTAQLSQYDQRDIKAAIHRLSLRRRSEGETALPDLGTVDEAVRDERSNRMRAEREECEREQAEAEERDRREHPENYFRFDIGEAYNRIRESKGLAKVEPAKRRGCCPECGAMLPTPEPHQSLTPKQLRELADVLERREGQNHADKDR